jgi:hypothetical protein
MERDFDELQNYGSRRAQASEELMLPSAEFVVLFAAAILLVGLVFGFVAPTIPIL